MRIRLLNSAGQLDKSKYEISSVRDEPTVYQANRVRFYTLPHSQSQGLIFKRDAARFSSLFLSPHPTCSLFRPPEENRRIPSCVSSLRMKLSSWVLDMKESHIPASCTSGGSACFSFEFSRRLEFPCPFCSLRAYVLSTGGVCK